MIRFSLFIVFLSFGTLVSSQSKTDAQFVKEYNARIHKEKIDRIYIPKDIEDAHAEMDKLMDSDAKLGFMKLSDAESARKYHFVFGRWMIKNWSLDRGSRLSAHLREKGIFRSDDMAMFIAQTYHRKLHMRPLDEAGLIAQITERYAAEKAERLKYKTVLSSERRIRKQQ